MLSFSELFMAIMGYTLKKNGANWTLLASSLIADQYTLLDTSASRMKV